MVECWAKVMGGCSTIQSGEHLVSKALFEGKMVTVQGFHWCLEPKSVGLASLTANILCTSHNSLLSPLDSAAGQTLDILGEAQRLHDVRRELKPRRFWTSKRYAVNGLLLERWFMKTLINLFHVVGRGAKWLISEQSADEPPDNLVEMVFGHKTVVQPLGLYATPQVGAPVTPPGFFGFRPVFRLGDLLAGALFQFQGFGFLLWACMETPPVIESVGIAQPMYRLRKIRFTIGGASSHMVELKWS
jgi:hypothetical protein